MSSTGIVFSTSQRLTQEDASDLRRLAALADRESVRALLTAIADQQSPSSATTSNNTAERPVSNTSFKKTNPAIKIQTYAWDQSDKFVKFYLTVPGAETVTPTQVVFTKSACNFEIVLRDCLGKDYDFSVNGLLREIDGEKSYFKLKKDLVLVFLKKKEVDFKWNSVTAQEEREKLAKEKKMKANVGKDSKDPMAGLMGMMKQMYDEGDDETKRSIRKTWHESQQGKNMSMNAGGLGDL